MKFFPVIFLCTIGLTTLSIHAERLNDKQIEAFIVAGYSSTEVQAQVKKQGYSGAVDAQTLQRLKKAGADLDLIQLLTANGGTVPATEPAKQSSTDSVTTSSSASRGSGSRGSDRWTNSLGMQFVPVPGTQVLFSIWDTRVKDYHEFFFERGPVLNSRPSFSQTENDPAVNVSWEDAKAFCEWLTKREHESGVLPANKSYRLPREAEWNVAVGEEKFPWGNQWPPPVGAGNYGQPFKVDLFEYTSPVGSFPANKYGLYDMGGNVNQWCEDRYDSVQNARVAKGGSYINLNLDDRDLLLSSYRSRSNPEDRNEDYGFRVVVSKN